MFPDFHKDYKRTCAQLLKHAEADFRRSRTRYLQAMLEVVRMMEAVLATASESGSEGSVWERIRSVVEQAQTLGDLTPSQLFSQVDKSLTTWSASDKPHHATYAFTEDYFQVSASDRLTRRTVKLTRRLHKGLRTMLRQTKNRMVRQETYLPADALSRRVDWNVITRALSLRVLVSLRELLCADAKLQSHLAKAVGSLADSLENRQNSHRDAIKEQVNELRMELLRRLEDHPVAMAHIVQSVGEDFKEEACLLGTVSLPMISFPFSRLNPKRIASTRSKDSAHTWSLLADWQTDFETRISQVYLDIGLQRFNGRVREELLHFAEDVKNRLSGGMIPLLERASMLISVEVSRFDDAQAADLQSVSDILSRLPAALHREAQIPLQQVVSELALGRVLEERLSAILLHETDLPEKGIVFDSVSDADKPSTKTAQLEFRREMTDFIKNELYRILRALPAVLQQSCQDLSEEFSEVRDIAEVNLRLAAELHQSGTSEAREIAILVRDGLKRAAKRADESVGEIQEMVARIDSQLESALADYLAVSTRIMLEDDYLYIRNKNREVRVRSAALDTRSHILRFLSRLTDATLLWTRYSGILTRNALERTRRVLGFGPSQSNGQLVRTTAAEFLSDADRKLGALPLIYRSLFSSDPLQDGRFYRGRMILNTMFISSYTYWKKGQFSNLVLVGERGSGKTSCMNLLAGQVDSEHTLLRGMIAFTTWREAELIGELCRICGYTPCDTADAFVQKVMADERRLVILLEGFQNMFLRHMDGFAALEAFLMILTRTGSRVFWVVSCSRHGWNYLSKLYQTEGYFTHTRYVDEVNREVLRDIVMSRHRVSGYDLLFEPDEDMRRSRAFRKLMGMPHEQQKLLQEDFFTELDKLARGNIVIAILYWLLAIKEVRNDLLVLTPLRDIKVELGDGFSSEDLFVIAAVLQHDDLTAAQLSLVLGESERHCLLVLSKLVSRSVLLDQGGRFTLNYLLFRQLVNVLESRNIIH